jgi:rsbT antagonist protein RsbS
VSQTVPILRLGDALLVSIQVDLQDDHVLALQEELAEKIVSTSARGVIIDISAVDIVDSFIGRMFSSIAALSRVLDAETVVVGMRPAVAITLVELGLSLDGVRTALDLEKGLAILARRTRARRPLEEDDPGYAPEDLGDPVPSGS